MVLPASDPQLPPGRSIDRITRVVGRAFFAIALIGLGAEHFLFREFVTGRAPAWPDALPGGTAWAYLTGAFFIVMGIAVLAGKRARLAAVLVAVLIFAWALLRHIPVVAAGGFLEPTWTHGGKALTLVGGALAVAGMLPAMRGRRDSAVARFVNLRREFVTLGRISLGIFLLITGTQHFKYTEFVALLIPGWFPGDPVFWTYFAGVALLAGGLGLQVPRTARLAALLVGLMVFSWFWIVHIPRVPLAVTDAISVFEALGVSGIAFALAGSLGREGQPRAEERSSEVESRAGAEAAHE